jgi:bifunctional UDP-N-acetylglucosamine pyrophosphorylase/glucosamine-1-phosphate N-acetyltransferase
VVNYDGYKKHRTTVEDGVFVGCNSNLISPVTLRKNAFVAAGSTVSKEVPEGALAVARVRQTNLEGWVARREGRSPAKTPGRTNEKAEKPDE